jgi:hypothetical protein
VENVKLKEQVSSAGICQRFTGSTEVELGKNCYAAANPIRKAFILD